MRKTSFHVPSICSSSFDTRLTYLTLLTISLPADPSRLLADDVSHLVRQLTTGYFALIISILFCIVGYEMEYIGKSVFYPKRPEGRNKFLHRLTHVAFWFENCEYSLWIGRMGGLMDSVDPRECPFGGWW